MTNKRASKTAANPEIVVGAAAILWGLYWIPLRALERHGLDPATITISQFVTPLAILAPFAVYRILRNQPTGVKQYGTGLLIGSAFVLYCESLLLTDVVRALILFYVMPAWGTLAEVVLMGRRFTLLRGLALALSMAGLFCILFGGDSLTISMNLGDAMALASGAIFSLGAMRVRLSSGISVFEQLFAFFLFGSIVSVVILVLPLSTSGQPPSLPELLPLLPWLVLIAVAFLIPTMWGVYWGSRFVDPGRLGILLQLEAVVGVISAALLAGEPFGWRELIGALLVISAGLTEIFGNDSRSPRTH